MIRDLVLTLTILAIIFLVANRPPPSRMVQVDCCVVDQHVAVKNPTTGEWMTGWGKGYAPCDQQDIYRNI